MSHTYTHSFTVHHLHK